jgi:GT2 family glycosyltransferase
MAEAKPSQTARIGIVTVTYNSETVLPEFFDSLSAQTWRNFVLYVIDNCSKDNTLEMVRSRSDLPIVVIANDETLGVAEGNNQGIRAALSDGCDSVLLLNNDTAFPADLLDSLNTGLEQHGCEMTVPKMYYYDRPTRIWCAGGYFHPWFAYRSRFTGADQEDGGQFDQPRRTESVPTCCLLIRGRVFDRVGLMDSRYFVYIDDTDFLYRCLKLQIPLWYVPKAKLWHKVSSLTGSAFSQFTLHYSTRNRAYFIVKHIPRLQAFLPMLVYELYFRLSCLRPDPVGARFRIRLSAWKEGKRMRAVD